LLLSRFDSRHATIKSIQFDMVSGVRIPHQYFNKPSDFGNHHKLQFSPAARSRHLSAMQHTYTPVHIIIDSFLCHNANRRDAAICRAIRDMHRVVFDDARAPRPHIGTSLTRVCHTAAYRRADRRQHRSLPLSLRLAAPRLDVRRTLITTFISPLPARAML
jgi:hypothetical protein